MASYLLRSAAAAPAKPLAEAAKVRRQKARHLLREGSFVDLPDGYQEGRPWREDALPDRSIDEREALREEARAALQAAAAREAALQTEVAELRSSIVEASTNEAALRVSVGEHVSGLESALQTARAEQARIAASAAESERMARAAISEAEAARREAAAARSQLFELQPPPSPSPPPQQQEQLAALTRELDETRRLAERAKAEAAAAEARRQKDHEVLIAKVSGRSLMNHSSINRGRCSLRSGGHYAPYILVLKIIRARTMVMTRQ